MKNIKYLILTLFAGYHISAQSVGITNTTEDPNPVNFPVASASLDTHFSHRGILIPKYDLQKLDDPTSPVDFTNDIRNNKNIDGTLIYNYGNTYEKGFFVWMKNRWYLTLHKSGSSQQLSINIPANTIVIPENIGKNKNILSSFNEISNNIDNASVQNNSITLPAGKYLYKYSADPKKTKGKSSSNYFSSRGIYSIKSYIQDTDGNILTNIQHSSKLSNNGDGSFLFYQGFFIFELTKPTTIQQVFQYDDGTSNPNFQLVTRTDFAIFINRFN